MPRVMMAWKEVIMLTADQYREAEFGYSLTEAKRGFKIHATVYALVMTGLIVLNALLIAYTDANFPWVVFPLVGWGIGLTFHYVYGYRRAEIPIRERQENVEAYAKRTKELV
jgi:Na+-driven multidrug efflux pump